MTNNIPVHIGFILDGNRRWARERGLPELEGHLEGRKRVKEIVKACKNRGIKIITLFVFSTENWKRSPQEVSFLLNLLEAALREDTPEVHQEGFRIKVLGQIERLPPKLQKTIAKAQDLTKNNSEGILNLAISYGGRAEITQALRKIVSQNVPADQITEELINKNLWTEGIPEPDLIIRTGGEQRLSGFLTWQSVYSELYFTPTYWPDFREKDLDEALKWFSSRQRRFGK